MSEISTKIENRRGFIINFFYFVLIAGLAFVSFKYFFWTVSPFLIAILVAVSLQKPIRMIEKKTKLGHTFISIALVSLLFLIIVGPIAALIGAITNEISTFVKYVVSNMEDIPAFADKIQTSILNAIKFLPETLYNSVAKSISTFVTEFSADIDFSKIGLTFDNIFKSFNSVFSVAKNIPDVLLSLIIGVVACIFMTKDYNRIMTFIKRQTPKEKRHFFPEIKSVFFNTIGKLVRAYLLIMLITFVEVFIGLAILSLFGSVNGSYIFVISLGVAVFDILPVLGAGGVLIPWAIYGMISKDFTLAIGLIIIYVVLLVFRQYIEPKIIGDQLGVHPLVTLSGMYFGLKLFGFIGIFVVPMFIMTLKALNDNGTVHLWKGSINPPKHKDKSKKSKFNFNFGKKKTQSVEIDPEEKFNKEFDEINKK